MRTAKLARVDIPLSIHDTPIMGDNFLRGPSGVVYRASFGTGVYEAEDHLNVDVQALDEIAGLLPSLGKSIAITGIEDANAFIAEFGLVRCNEDGTDIVEGIEL